MKPNSPSARTVSTVLGPVPADDLGVTSVHEALLSVLPGAQYAPDISMDRADIYDRLSTKVLAFKEAGGGTLVDSTGMFHGRDLKLYESLSKATGVHIVASTGLGPEEEMGGYFLTPQTDPPTPWPAEKFADLLGAEASEGMVVPRVERRAPAGLVTAIADVQGMTATEQSLFRGSARAARDHGVPLSMRPSDHPLHDVDVVLNEGIDADRVLVGDLDRRAAHDAVIDVARRGTFLGIDHVGASDAEHLDDEERADLVLRLLEEGHRERLILSSNAIGVAKGLPDTEVDFTAVLGSFTDLLRRRGLADGDLHQLLVRNPADLLSVRPAA